MFTFYAKEEYKTKMSIEFNIVNDRNINLFFATFEWDRIHSRVERMKCGHLGANIILFVSFSDYSFS